MPIDAFGGVYTLVDNPVWGATKVYASTPSDYYARANASTASSSPAIAGMAYSYSDDEAGMRSAAKDYAAANPNLPNPFAQTLVNTGMDLARSLIRNPLEFANSLGGSPLGIMGAGVKIATDTTLGKDTLTNVNVLTGTPKTTDYVNDSPPSQDEGNGGIFGGIGDFFSGAESFSKNALMPLLLVYLGIQVVGIFKK